MFWLNQINPDSLTKMQGSFFNKAKNELASVIAHEEDAEYKEIYGRPNYEEWDDKRGDPIG